MIRVVIDTNVVVSALLQPLGPPAAVFLLAVGGAVQICVSGGVYAEYEEVIRRPPSRASRRSHRRHNANDPGERSLGEAHGEDQGVFRATW
jgi:predicted nucleic acid-binding protein